MKPIARRGLGLLLVVTCILVWMLSTSLSRKELRSRTCQGKGTLEVFVTDSLERRFVTREDIENWLENEYRAYAGLPLDSVNLDRIEHIICAHSAVRDCEAWLTDDGILHVSLSQRQPGVRFQDGQNGYYSDAEGFLFPLQARGSVQVPVVDGHLPVHVPKGYKGPLTDAKDVAWLQQILGMVNMIHGTIWEKNISQITINRDGDLVLIPREGKERFLFGAPTRVREKLELMAAYYESVAPSKEPGWYTQVDVRHRKQLVCRK